MPKSKMYYPMLASPGSLQDLERPEYVYEHKLDGIRCIAILGPGLSDPILLSRNNKNISDQFPDIVQQLRRCRESCVLDGEIIVRKLGSQRSAFACDFQALQTRLQRIDDVQGAALEAPAEFIAFDMLEYNGYPMIIRPWHQRRNDLVALCQEAMIPTTMAMDHTKVKAAWQDLISDGCEGVMAKHRGSTYEPGTRSKLWLKIKPILEDEFIIGGLTHGYGRRKELFGGLIVGQTSYANLKALRLIGQLEFVAVVGSGLTDALMMRLLSELRIVADCPFIAQGPGSPPAAKYWIEPDHIAKVKYQDLTRDKKLRFPTLVSVSRILA